MTSNGRRNSDSPKTQARHTIPFDLSGIDAEQSKRRGTNGLGPQLDHDDLVKLLKDREC